jgi:hypothetical protein
VSYVCHPGSFGCVQRESGCETSVHVFKYLKLYIFLFFRKTGKRFALVARCTKEVSMNWLNDMIIELQRKVLGDKHNQSTYHATSNDASVRNAEERVLQFQSRLQDLDKRILELR